MRLLSKLVLTLMLVVVVSLTTLIGLLHTRYNESLLNFALAQISPYQILAKKIDYDIRKPYQIRFEHAEVTQNKHILFHADSIQLWLSKQSFNKDKLIFDGLQINNIAPENIQHAPQFPPLEIKRLVLNNTNINTPQFTIKQGLIQIDNWQTPTNNTPWWQSFNGNLQISATSIKWHQLQLQKLLINADKQGQQWQFNGFSADWHQATITAQAQLNNNSHHLNIDQLTVSQFRLQDQHLLNDWLQQFTPQIVPFKTITLKRLDVVNSSIELPQGGADDINLSLENWQWPQNYWQQKNSRLSFSASHAKWHQLNVEQPLAELQFMPQQIISHGMSANLLGGSVRIDGWVDPQQLFISSLKANGIKWFLDKNWRQTLQQWQHRYTDVIIKKLDINNSQITSPASTFPFQLAGIDIDAQDAVLKQNNQWGLWQGNIEANLGFGSLNQVIITQAIATMHSNAGQWQLDKLVLPFKQGILKARARIALNDQQRPWQLTVMGDSVPVQTLYRWLSLPLPFTGVLDTQIKLQGQAGDRTGFNTHLTGSAQLDFRQLALNNISPQQLLTLWQQPDLLAITQPRASSTTAVFPMPTSQPLTLIAQQGTITLSPWKLTANDFAISLDSQWNLADPKQQQLTLKLTTECQNLIRQWHQGLSTSTINSSCTGNTKYVPVNVEDTALPH